MGLASASGWLGKQFYEEHYNYILVIRGFFPDDEPAAESDYEHIKKVFVDCGRYWHCYRPFINFNNVPSHASKSIEVAMDIGDLVDDELFVIDLIRKISCEYPKSVWKFSTEYGCVLSEHLSDYFPKWLDKVEDADNRVFLQNGRICFYKLEKNAPVDLKQIIRVQLEPASLSVHSLFMAAFSEDKHQQKIHNSKVFVPKEALKYLNLRENLSLSIKAAHCEGALKLDDISKFKSIKTENFVETTLQFTRQQFFYLFDLNLPIPKDYPSTLSISELLGCKLTVGLEALLEIERIVLEQDPSGGVCEDPEDEYDWQMDEAVSMLAAEQMERKFHSTAMEIFKDGKYREEKEDSTDGEEYETDSECYYYQSDSGFVEKDLSDEYETTSEEEDEEEGGEFVEREILEAMKHDPDLLMRIIELNSYLDRERESATLVNLLKELEIHSSIFRQKGVADIDPHKLAEARQPRELPEYSDDDDESDLSNDDGEADLPYGESVEEAKKQKRIFELDD